MSSRIVAWSARVDLGTTVPIFGITFGPKSPEIVQLKGGDLVASWRNFSLSDSGLLQQASVFSSSGTSIKPTYDLTYTDGSKIVSSNFLRFGDFSLSDNKVGGLIGVVNDGSNIKLQEFDREGTPGVSNANVVTPAAGSDDIYGPADVAASSRISSLITYGELGITASSLARTTDMYTLFGKTYSPLINRYGSEKTLISGDVENFSTHALENGNYLVVAGQAKVVAGLVGFIPTVDRDESLVFTILNESGAFVVNTKLIAESQPVREEFEVFNDYVATGLSNSGFVVAYKVRNGDPEVGHVSFHNVVQIYNSAGSQVASNITADGTLLGVASLPQSEFVIIYQSGSELRAQHFSATGVVLSDALLGAVATALVRNDVDVVGLQDGRFAVTWVVESNPAAFQIFDTRDAFNDAIVNPDTQDQIGTVFDDVFKLGAATRLANGAAGNDTITQFGGTNAAGPATLMGGDGNDTIVMKQAFNADKIDGGAGNDTIDWGALTGFGGLFNLATGIARGAGNTQSIIGFENLIATSSGDVITGNSEKNVLIGLAGNDTISGGGGEDTVEGGPGNDILDAGDKSDTYVFRIGTSSNLALGSDTIADSGGSDGSDVIRIDSLTQILSSQRTGNDLLLKLKQGDITIKDHFGKGQIEFLNDGAKNVVLATGKIGGDAAGIISGNSDAELLDGRGGDDLLYGAGGNDTLLGSDGNDLLQGDGDNDRLDGGNGIDTARFAGLRADYGITSAHESKTVTDKIADRDGTDELTSVERLAFEDGTLAFDFSGNTGKSYALFKALLGRDPDSGGLGYFTRHLDNGGNVDFVANAIINSSEYSRNGTSNAEFVKNLYAKWLNRAPDQEGFDYWVGRLDMTQGEYGSAVADFLASPSVLQQSTASAPVEGLWFV